MAIVILTSINNKGWPSGSALVHYFILAVRMFVVCGEC